MKIVILTGVLLATFACCWAADPDPDCAQRRLLQLPLHWEHPTDCEKFYRCTNRNIKREIQCPNSKVYNPKSGKCSPERKLCRKKDLISTSNLNVASNVDVCSNQPSDSFLPNPTNCRSYYICHADIAYIQDCDVDSYFNETLLICQPDTQRICWKNKCIDKDDGTMLPNQESCHEFYLCHNGETFQQTCNENSYFDSNEFICKPGDCPKDVTTIEPPTDSTTAVESINTESTTEEPNTKESTTGEPATLGSTTHESSTEKSTTTEPTTKDTTTEEPATEKSTTVEPTTDGTTTVEPISTESTTEESTTKKSTTGEPTTLASTTIESSTEKSTTTEPTTKDTTTEEPATEKSTTGEPTTDGTTTVEPTNTESTTEEPTTKESATGEPTTLASTTNESSTEESTTTESTTKYTTTVEPTTDGTTSVEPINTESTTEEPTTKESTTGEPTTLGSTTTELTTIDTTTEEPATKKSTGEPTTDGTTTVEPISTESTTEEPATQKSTTGEPTTDGTTTVEPINTESTTEEPTTKESTTGEPTTLGSTTTELTTIDTTTEEPATEKSTTKDPTTKESTTLQPTEPSTLEPCTCSGGHNDGDFVAHETDCSMFYICYNGTLFELSCNEGNYYDAANKMCVTGACKRPTKSLPPYYRKVDNIKRATTINQETHRAKRSVAELLDQENLENCTCPGGYNEGELLQHPTECEKFYICHKRQLIDGNCGIGKRFDVNTLSCIDDDMQICWTYEPPEDPFACTAANNGTWLPHETQCNEYYVCVNSAKILQSCGVGKFFNNITANCVPDTQNVCWKPTANYCADKPEGQLIKHPTQCDYFYICHKNLTIMQQCSGDAWFDPSALMCKPDVNAICHNPCENITGSSDLPHPDCRRYYQCTNRQTHVEICPSGMNFDKILKRCSTRAVCSNICDDSIDGSVFPVPADNKSFYICYDHVPVQQNCKPGSSFDPAQLICSPTGDASCDQSKCPSLTDNAPFATINDSHGFCICNGKAAVKRMCIDGGIFDAEMLICRSNGACNASICLSAPHSTAFPAVNDKHAFCWCNGRTAVKKNCTDGGIFDPITAVCRINETCISKICPHAPENTVFPTTNDQHAFCVCKDKKAVKVDCLDGGTFNPNLSVCKSPGNGFCDPDVCPKAAASSIFAAYNDQKSYCICIDNKAALRTCINGGIFNPKLLICQKPKTLCDGDTVCQESNQGVAFPLDNDNSSFCVCSGHEAIKLKCPGNMTFNREKLACLSPLTTVTGLSPHLSDLTPLCNGKYKQGEFVRHPSECNKFHICYDGELQEQSCGKKAYFDTKRNQCTPTSVNNPECIPSELSNSETCSCVGGYGEGNFIAHPTDCDKFYICQNSKLMEHSCGHGNYFDKLRNYCMRDTEKKCNDKCTCVGAYQEGDLIGHPTDCDKFFICFKGKLEEQSCGKGNYYDMEEKECRLDRDKKCTPKTECTCTGGYKEGDLIAHPTDCDKFYICYNGTLSEKPCGEGNYFDSKEKSCMLDTLEKCKPKCKCVGGYNEGDLVTHSTDCDKFYICYNGKLVEQSCGNGNYYDTKEKECRVDINNKCTPKTSCTCVGGYNEGDLVAHPTDCDKFYICYNGTLSKKSCGEGNFFDVKKKSCMVDTLETCNPKCKCVGGYREGDLVAHPTDCDKFYICHNSELEQQNCGVGNRFDRSTLTCIRDERELCWIVAPPQKSQVCTPVNNGAWLPHETQCDKFYICLNSTEVLQTCDPGYKFDSAVSDCVLDRDGTCWKMISNFCANKPQGTFIKHQRLCNHFYICFDNKVALQSCQEGNWFNPKEMMCEPDVYRNCSTVRITPQLICQTTTDDNTIIADSTDSTGYYVCQKRKAIKRQCPSYTIFDDELKICNPKIRISCNPGVCKNNNDDDFVFPSLTDPHGFCVCSNGNAEKISCKPGSTFDKLLSICQPAAAKCIGQQNGHIMGYPGDQRLFYVCENSAAIRRKCPTGHLFDEGIKVCRESARIMRTNRWSKDICDGQRDGILLPGEKCNEFVICLGNVSLPQTCGAKAAFNQTLGTCQYDVSCYSSIFCTQFGDMLLAVENDDTSYIECHSGIALHRKCPAGTKYYHDEEICLPEDVLNKLDQLCSDMEDYTFRVATSCQKFYMCLNQKARLFDCGNYRRYDPLNKFCVPDFNMECTGNSSIMRSTTCDEGVKRPIADNCSQYEFCVDRIWLKMSCPNHHYYSTENKACLKVRDDTVCSFAKVAVSTKCQASNEYELAPVEENMANIADYYRCNNGKWVLQSCDGNKSFNPKFKSCMTRLPADANDDPSSLDNNSTSCTHMDIRENKHNCAMFYMCVDDNWWYQHYCPLGMYFNRTQNYCIPDDGTCPFVVRPHANVQQPCWEMQNCTVDGAMTASTNSSSACDQFYVCVRGKWLKRKCNSGYYFNATASACLPEDQSCSPSVRSNFCIVGQKRAYPMNCSAFEMCTNDGQWIRKSCPEKQSFDETINECTTNDGSCSKSGLRRVCLSTASKSHPASNDCKKFYYCSAGQWMVGNCLPGNAYNATAASCVSDDGSYNCHCGQTDNTNVCAGKPDGTYIPHRCDCTKLYICIDETPIEKQCSDGGYFDGKECRLNDGTCKVTKSGPCWDQEIGAVVGNPNDCTSFFKCNGKDDTLLYICPEGEFFDNLAKQCRQDHGECLINPNRNICKGQEHGSRLPNENYCNIYYACVGGIAIQAECPDDQIFNSALRKCLPDDNEICTKGNMVRNSSRSYDCAGYGNGTLVADLSDCTKYYICSDVIASPRQCLNGSFFDSSKLLCMPNDGSCPYVGDNEKNTTEDAFNPKMCAEKHGTLIADPLNCRQFYSCINGKLRHDQCNKDHFFNRSSTQCEPNAVTNNGNVCLNPPMNATEFCSELQEGDLIANPSDCRRLYECLEGKAMSERCRNGESFDSILGFCRQNDGTCLLENGKRVGACAGSHGSLVRNPDNCRAYFVCINGQKIPKKCQDDEYFDKLTKVCVKDELGQCNPEPEPENKEHKEKNSTLLNCAGLSDTIFYPNINDGCRSYFKCIKNEPQLHPCDDGMFFDFAKGMCVRDMVDCLPPLTTTTAAALAQRMPNVDAGSTAFVKKKCQKALNGDQYVNVTDDCDL